MFNFNNFNPNEFECLCKDILESILNTKLRTYKQGKDDGIDIKCFTYENNIIGQVKHYNNFNNLHSILKKEVPKVNKLSPKEYYILTNLELSPNNVRKIYNLFKDYMLDESHIIDGVRINDFLSENENIVEKHYKLWLTSSNVLSLINNQNILIDCEGLLDDIENESKFYVETSFYTEALNILDKEKLLILLGSPGVGKTTLSKMIILYYIAIGYHIRFSSDLNISDIKNTISEDDSKEIILLDDFLGQHYLNLNESKPNEIKYLISFIKKYKNKKLILNSRITIFNEAKEKYSHFENCIGSNKESIHIIDLDYISNHDKAKIFYNHLYFNNIPKEYFNNIRANKDLINIIKHKNYNPRIIEYVTQKRNYETVIADNYTKYILEQLNNPEDIWHNEFIHRMNKIDRIFMHTLYSLTSHHIEKSILEECFNKRIENESDIDTTINNFEQTFKRLSNSTIKHSIDKENKSLISAVNPSVNDYIFHQLKNNKQEVISIFENALYIEQCITFKEVFRDEINNYFNKKIINAEIEKLKNIKYFNIYFYILEYIYQNQIFDKKFISIVHISLANIYKPSPSIFIDQSISTLISAYFTKNIIDFYNILDFVFTDIDSFGIIISNIEIDISLEVINLIYDECEYSTKYNINKIINNVRDTLINQINSIDPISLLNEENFYAELEEAIYDYIELLEEKPDRSSSKDEIIDNAFSSIFGMEKYLSILEEKIDEYLDNIPELFCISRYELNVYRLHENENEVLKEILLNYDFNFSYLYEDEYKENYNRREDDDYLIYNMFK